MSAARSMSELFFANNMTNRHFMTTRRVWVTFVTISTLLAGGALGISQFESSAGPAEEESPEILPVRVLTLEPVSSFDQSRTYTGTIVARRSATIGFERSARLESVTVDEGDPVVAGQVLATLDVRHLETRQQQLLAQRSSAEAVLAELIAGPRKETIAAAKARVVELRAQSDLSQRTLTRTRQLEARNAATAQSLDDSQFSMEAAAARLAAAERELEELEVGTRAEQIAAQRARVAELDALLADIELDRADSVLKAPFSGQVATRYADEGTVVATDQTILRIVETDVLEARIGLPAENAAKLTRGDSAQIQVGSDVTHASFVRLLPEVDLQTRTQIAVFDLDPSSGTTPGRLARISRQETVLADGFWLPATALSPGERGLWSAYAVIRQDGQSVIERRPVEILHTEGERVLVKGMIRSGDQIVEDGIQRVVPGQAVSVIR